MQRRKEKLGSGVLFLKQSKRNPSKRRLRFTGSFKIQDLTSPGSFIEWTNIHSSCFLPRGWPYVRHTTDPGGYHVATWGLGSRGHGLGPRAGSQCALGSKNAYCSHHPVIVPSRSSSRQALSRNWIHLLTPKNSINTHTHSLPKRSSPKKHPKCVTAGCCPRT